MNKNLRIDYSKTFLKQLKKAPLDIKIAFSNRLALFIENPIHPQLNNHSLSGKYTGLKSINITGDWRGVFSEHADEESNPVVVFKLLGTHSQLYK